MNVNIADLSKEEVLLALYNNALFCGAEYTNQPRFNVLALTLGRGKKELAQSLIESGQLSFDYIDLGAGSRPLKVDIAKDEFNPDYYDREHGEPGYAMKIIDSLRQRLAYRGLFQTCIIDENKVLGTEFKP